MAFAGIPNLSRYYAGLRKRRREAASAFAAAGGDSLLGIQAESY